MMQFLRLLAWSFISAALAIAALGGAGYWLYRDAEAPGPLAGARTVVIPAHTGTAGIANQLTRDGVILHPLTFEVMAKLSGRGGMLKPGEYEFPAAASVMQTLDVIAGGRTVKHHLTIPEGLTSPEVMTLVRNAPALIGDTGPLPADGELLPDTYVYSYGEARQELIAHMRRAMAHVVAEMWHERRPDLPLTSPKEAVILASIIEKETAREEERAHVAGVFINRLRLGMRLQSDPTVLFALGDDGTKPIERALTHADLSIASPFNTYQIKGLPPAPIDNPSRSSLRAAVRPERTEDLYFVADGSGGHIFAKTLPEQTRNIAQYRRGAAFELDPLPTVAPLAAPVAPVAAPPPEPAHPAVRHAAATVPRRPPARQQTARLRHCKHDTGRACQH